MTKQEASEKYNIPFEILGKYEGWGLRESPQNAESVYQYDDEDLDLLSTIVTLHGIGFQNSEVEAYMRLLLAGSSTAPERLAMLNKQRSALLDEIHAKEKQLDSLDYLRHKLESEK